MIRFSLSEKDIIDLEEKYKEAKDKKILLEDVSFLPLCILANQKELQEQIEELRARFLELARAWLDLGGRS